MCLNELFDDGEDDDELHELGAYKSYITLKNSIQPLETRNAIVYNDVMEELNYRDNEGHLWTLKLFTTKPLSDKYSLMPSPPLP